MKIPSEKLSLYSFFNYVTGKIIMLTFYNNIYKKFFLFIAELLSE